MQTYIDFLKKYVKSHTGDVTAGIILALMSTGISIISPMITQFLVDKILLKGQALLLEKMLLLITLVLLISTLTFLAYNSILVRCYNQIGYEMKVSLYKHFNQLDVSAIKDISPAYINYRIFGDADVLKNSLGQTLFSMIINTFYISFIIAYMLWLNWQMTIFTLAIMSLQILVVIKFHKPVHQCAVDRKTKTESTMTRLVEIFGLFHLVKACGNEEKEEIRFSDNMRQLTDISIKEAFLSMFSSATSGAVNGMVTFGILWYGGLQVVHGGLSLGALMAFLLVSNMVSGPINGLASAVISFQDVKASAARVLEVFAHKSNLISPANALKPILEGNLNFNNVVFGYSPAAKVLKGVSFQVPARSIVSIVGRSGIGKTTISKLVARFYDPESGEIFVDGCNLKGVDLNYYRKHVGFLLQNDFLFSGTIMENIGLGNAAATQAEIKEAAEKANAHGFISRLPDGYWTEVGQGGSCLSGGEAQRVALARIFLQDPRIVLLDEVTSFVDMESEEHIHNALLRLAEKSTILIITHKLSTAKLAGKIIVLDNGEVVETGTHDELIERNGPYVKLYRKFLA